MKIPAIDEPIKLGRVFWATYCMTAIPSALLLHPWTWDAPLVSRIAGAILPPFLISIVLYSVVLFTISVTTRFGPQKRTIVALAFALSITVMFLVIPWLAAGRERLPSIVSLAASVLASLLLSCMNHKTPNHVPDPTPPVTAPAGQEPRRP